MKRPQLLFTFIQLPVDFLMIVVAFLLAYKIRLLNILAPDVIYVMPFMDYLNLIIWVAIAWVVVFALMGMYSTNSNLNLSQSFSKIFIAVSVSLALFIVILFGFKEQFFSRLIAAYAWALIIILVFLGRFIISVIKKWLLKVGLIKEKVVLIGDKSVAKKLQHFFVKQFNKVSVINKAELENGIAKVISKSNTDQVIVTIDLPTNLSLELINFCELNGIRFQYLPNLVELYSANAGTNTIHGYPFIELKPTPLDGWGRILKRSSDFISSALALIILSPVMIIIAILVKIDSPGVSLFVQERPGQFGKTFKFYKFRSMYTHLSTGQNYGGAKAEAYREHLKKTKDEGAGLLFKIKNDPRVTKIGQFLRKTSLDELPQLFNVLNGEMSLVGPRPPLMDEVANYDKKLYRRLLVKPGMTGMWQISGRNDTSFEEYLKLDMYYIEHWTPWLDLQIIIKTVWVATIGRGAY